MQELKKFVKTDKLIIGLDRVTKALKKNSVENIYISSNCPANAVETINKYAAFSKVNIKKLDIPNDELGIVCKKMFSISILGIKR